MDDLQGETIIGYRRNTQLWAEIEQRLIRHPRYKTY